MQPHHFTFLQWLNHNFALISLVWFPAFICYLRAFVDSCKIVGWTKLADELGKFELFLTTFVSSVKAQTQTPPVPPAK